MSYRFLEPHTYVDLSKKKPYICGICLHSITDPIHQLAIEGTEYVPELRLDMQDAPPERPARVEDTQLSFF